MADEPPAPKPLSPLKRFLGLLLLLAVMLVCGSLGLWLRRLRGGPGPAVVAQAPPIAHLAVAVVGAAVLVAGALLYGLLLLTRCFTFSFSTPFYRSLRPRMWVANLLVGLFVTIGFGLMLAAPLTIALGPLLPPPMVGLLAFFVPVIVLQFVLMWLNLWAPLDVSLIRRRLLALGVAPEVQAQGMYVGLSDPSKSSWLKFGGIEDDLGMLWLHPAGLIYRGDASGWDLPREHVVSIDRRADSGATSSYFGASTVELVVRDVYGRESRIRVHTEGDWTLTGRAKRLNELADRLEAWKNEPAPTAPTSPAPRAAAAAPAVTSP